MQDTTGSATIQEAKLLSWKPSYYPGSQATILEAKLLSKTLQERGLELNLYDQSVAIKNIKGKQCKIIWHIDDLEEHVKKEEVIVEYCPTTSMLVDFFAKAL